MLQVYFLSVMANIIGGGILAGEFLSEKIPALNFLSGMRDKKGVKLTAGLTTAVIGILGLIFKAPTESVPFAGDLLPSLIAIGIGGLLVVDNGKREQIVDDTETEQTEVELSTDVREKLVRFRTPVGIAGVVAGLVHFFMPGVLLL